MTAYTYPQLQDLMEQYFADSEAEFLNMRPTLIARAEARVYGDLQLDPMMVDAEINLPTTSTLVPKPANCISTQEVRYGSDSGPLLLERTIAVLNTLRADLPPGDPEYWGEISMTQLLVAGRRPVDASPDEKLWTRYSAPEEQLSTSQETTWISTQFGDLLLDACLWEGELFNKHGEGASLRANDYGLRLPQALAYLEGRRRQSTRS